MGFFWKLNLFIAVVFSSSLIIFSFANSTAIAQGTDEVIQEGLCAGANLQLSDGNCAAKDESGIEKINKVVRGVVNTLSLIVGIVAVIMIIIGGLRYITSGGASDKVSGAKDTIVFAIVGLVVVALAQVIVRFVLNRVATSG